MPARTTCNVKRIIFLRVVHQFVFYLQGAQQLVLHHLGNSLSTCPTLQCFFLIFFINEKLLQSLEIINSWHNFLLSTIVLHKFLAEIGLEAPFLTTFYKFLR